MAKVSPEAIRYATRDNAFFMRDLYRGLEEVDLSALAPQLTLEETIYTLARHAEFKERQAAKNEHVFSGMDTSFPKAVVIQYISDAVSGNQQYDKQRPAGPKQEETLTYDQWNHPRVNSLVDRLGKIDEKKFKPIMQQLGAKAKSYVLPGEQGDIIMDFLPEGITRETWAKREEEVKEAYCQKISDLLSPYAFKEKQRPQDFYNKN